MGREAAITYEEVAAAADACKVGGAKPTSRGIREQLGNVGSMGTVNKLLQRWKANQGYQVAPAMVLPTGLQRAILEFMDQEATKVRAALEGELVEHQQEAADLATENERQLELIEAQAAQLEALGADKAAADGKAAQLALDLDGARVEAAHERAAAEMGRIELAKAQLRLEALAQLESDQVVVRVELDKERLARIASEQAAAVLTAQKTDLEARLQDWRGQVDRAAEQLVKVQERAERLTTALDLERTARIQAEQSAAVLSVQKADLDGRLMETRVLVDRFEEHLAKAPNRANQDASGLSAGPEAERGALLDGGVLESGSGALETGAEDSGNVHASVLDAIPSKGAAKHQRPARRDAGLGGEA